MLYVYLLRHGETTWNAVGQRYCGITDVPLTEKGISQAKDVAIALQHISFDAIYSSPFQRAYCTAEVIAANKQEVITDNRLKETNFGIWEGLSLSQIQEQTPQLWEAWRTDPDHTAAGKNGETAKEVVQRADLFFEEALHKHPTGHIAVIAHNGLNRFYLAHKLGMPLRNYRKIYQENAAITLFSLDHTGELDLLKLNS